MFFYRRHVDDCFWLVEGNSDMLSILKSFNSVHANIRFSIEEEKDSLMNFLDIIILRTGEGLKTTVLGNFNIP